MEQKREQGYYPCSQTKDTEVSDCLSQDFLTDQKEAGKRRPEQHDRHATIRNSQFRIHTGHTSSDQIINRQGIGTCSIDGSAGINGEGI